jgi:hypothetical protein
MTLLHQIRNRYSNLAAPLTAFAIIAVVALAFNAINPPWQNWSPSGCFPNCFCEAVRPGFIRQPANTYSNLAFILIGLVIAGTGRPVSRWPTQTHNRLQSHPGYPRLYGWAVFAIGAGSLFYHASLTFVGQFFDWLGMYAFITFVIVYNASRFVRGRGGLFGIAYAVLLATLGSSFFFTSGLRTQIYTYLLFLSIGLEVFALLFKRPRVNLVLYLAALACLIFARIIWGWDIDGTFCNSHSLWQGHALWHILTALATAFLFRYYLSERPRP